MFFTSKAPRNRSVPVFRLGALMEYSEQERTENLEQVLQIKDGRIYPAQALKAFMITTNPVIAKSDCLFYAVKATGDPIF